jgi:hypothetical protein
LHPGVAVQAKAIAYVDSTEYFINLLCSMLN